MEQLEDVDKTITIETSARAETSQAPILRSAADCVLSKEKLEIEKD